ncbi:MAG: hypothetical protein Q4G36_00210 [Paracoccus sp. (in: a-proteobacteria)]|nr:hypothetical protein [Paracoccus sp. (in: a-proteobacteria)]
MRAFAQQAFGNYRAYSVPIDPVEMILDKVVNPAWFIALFSTLAGFAMPGRDAFETLVAVAVLQAGALVALRSPEIFRAEAETNVLPAVTLSSRSLVYLVAVRILPQMLEGLAILLVVWLIGCVLYGPEQPLAGLGYGVIALASLSFLAVLFSALSLMFDDYNLLSNICWSAVILLSGALLPDTRLPEGNVWTAVRSVLPGNASLAALRATYDANGLLPPSLAVTLGREIVVCLIFGIVTALIFHRALRIRLERA